MSNERFISLPIEVADRMRAYATKHGLSMSAVVELAVFGERSPRPPRTDIRRCARCRAEGHYAKTCTKERTK